MPVPLDALIHERFEARVAEAPEAIAIACEGIAVTYGELDARANRLAHALREHGVTAETLVGVLLEPSVEVVVAVLGILKAGGAYVPVDATHPAARVRAVFEDSAVDVVVSTASLAGLVPAGVHTLIRMDEDAAQLAKRPSSPVGAQIAPSNAAYVIYTSGSTGTPKGVVVTHHNVVRLFDATRPHFSFDGGDVWTLFHSIAFDFSVWELWGALLHGGTLVIVARDVARSPDRFHAVLVSERVTVLSQTPAAFRELMQHDATLAAEAGLSLRYVVFGGEALDIGSLRAWIDRHGDESPQLVNMYGITETTVHVTYRRIRRSDLDSGARCMIGGPIADLRLYVLDEQRTPVPPGTVGEIYVGGAGVARCYLNRPELTAGRFLPDPFSNTPNARMYRSGDMACWLSAGDLEYRGRIDEQVKVRGFRIELREVEAALRKTPGIGDAAAGTIEDGEGNRILVAWYTNALGSTATSAKEIRGALATAVPEHLVPSRFVRVERIPRTVNGKVDRGALPAPGRQRPDLGGPMVAPGSRAERWLAAHWCDVLNLDEVGVDDPFFELGGTSLAAMRLLGTVSRELGRAISPLLFFQSPTVAALARRLSNDHPEALAAALGKAPVATDSAVRDGPARERDELRARRMRRRNVG